MANLQHCLAKTAGSLRLPDFIIAGAQRSGTTWLYQTLKRHPRLYLAGPAVPEPKFFLVDEVYRRGLEFYSGAWFADAPPGAQAGEKSTNYLESAAAAGRMKQDVPHVRLVFLLRDPVERAYSNYLFSRKNGLEKESFADALALEEQREAAVPVAWRYARPHAYFSRGRYADCLQTYFEAFPRDQILCLNFDDLRQRSGWLAAEVHRFLGVAPRPEDAENMGVVNQAEPRAVAMTEDVRRSLTARYAEPNRRLRSLLGGEFASWLTR